MYQFREATAQDREAILALRQRCYGDVDPEKRDPQFWDWEFAKRSCHPERSRVFVGEDANGIVTHIAFVPYAGCDASIRVVVAVDAMTAPEARGGGAYSGLVSFANDALRDDFDAIHGYQIRKAVLGAMLRNGWVNAESIPVLVRPASLRALLKWNVTPGTRTESAESLTRDNAAEMAKLARTREFIEWRFFDNPRWSYRVTGARDREGRLVAWLVSRRTLLKSFDTQAIVDIAFTDASAARRLIGDAIAEAKNLGCALVAAFASRAHPARALLRRSFFIPGPHRFRLLVYSFGRAPRREPWQVTWADTDHL